MARKKSNKKIVFSQFLAWLEGVEDMQEDDWSPNASQWNTIREKLNCVIPDEIEIQYEPPQVSGVPPIIQAPPVGFANTQSVFESPGSAEVKESDKSPRTIPSAMKPQNNGNIKTPNIDTSTGPYKSELI